MQKEITLENKTFSYELRHSARARRVRLVVRRDGSVLLVSPARLRDSIAERFVQEKSAWVLSKIEYFSALPPAAPISPLARFSRRDYLRHREAARELVTAKVERFAALYGFAYNSIRVKNSRSNWGSCSRRGNLNFSYKILFLPSELQDYVIVHELCHLKEMNHSPWFWALVGEQVSNPKEKRRELRRAKI